MCTSLKNTSTVLKALSLAAVVLAASAGWASGGDPQRVDRVSAKSFSDTLSALEKTIKSEGPASDCPILEHLQAGNKR